MRKKFLVFGSPLIESPEIKEVERTLRSGWLGSGPKVHAFEEAFRKYIGSGHAAALNSCSSALHLSLLAAGIGPGDEVITTPLTFCSTANAIIHSGAKPVFADIEKDTMNIDPAKIASAVTKMTKAIIPVHMAGRPCDMSAIMDIAKKKDLVVIEDAAHAIEAVYKRRKIGTIGDMTCFSFYVTKNIVTGEGGMVTTNNKKWSEKIKIYSMHGMNRNAWKRYGSEKHEHYETVLPGFNCGMTDIQASLGIHQLKRIGKYLQRRNEIWKMYDDAFSGLPVKRPAKHEKDTVHARHLYTLILDIDTLRRSRDEIQGALYRENIGTGIHFISLHLQEYFRKAFSFRPQDFPNAKHISDRTISLPFSAKLSDRDVDDVIRAVKKVLS